MDKYYFAALFAAFGSRSAEIAEAAAKFKSPAEAYMAPPEAWAEAGIDEKTVNKFIARRDFNYPAWLKEFCLNNGVTILAPEDDAYPYSLKQIASPPQVLYVKGSLPDLRGSIGIVQQDVFLFAGTILDNIRYCKRRRQRHRHGCTQGRTCGRRHNRCRFGLRH